MRDEAIQPDDQPTVENLVPSPYETAAIARARQLLQETAAPAAVPEAVVGAVIGRRYKLLELIGEGGMGVVWMAEQRSPIRRLVAVKLIKAGMDSTAVLARFEAERQALAMMDHPNIARIFDGGTTDRGNPFFVMELVKGLPLTRYCDERKMSLHERLNLFVQICGAVQHAHQKGIIHRDLKPGNLLVTEHDGHPVPKVIDFGLVKALGGTSLFTDHTLHTSFGAVAGTPLYMAPEQVAINALDVDTRVDIYALGVILYELLAGTTPHEAKQLHQAAWEEVRRVIREVDPPRPSLRITQSKTRASLAATRDTEPARLSKLIAGELDWIVMKALEKDRHRRYGTASDLAADLQRHLIGEAVLAAPPSNVYRVRKFTRRYRVALGTAAVVLLVLVAGVLVSTWQAVRAGRAESVAQRETAEAKKQKDEAQRQKGEAERQRTTAIAASNKAEAESAMVQRQLADSYVQSGISAWSQQDPALAALWFSKALKLDQGDVHRERSDRVRLGDSFRRCLWPSDLSSPAPEVAADGESFQEVRIGVDKDGARTLTSGRGDHIRVGQEVLQAYEGAGFLLLCKRDSAQICDAITGKGILPVFEVPYLCGCRVSSDHRFLVTTEMNSAASKLRIWSAISGNALRVGSSTTFEQVQFSPDGNYLAASDGSHIQVWVAKTMAEKGPLLTCTWQERLIALNNRAQVLLRSHDYGWRAFNASDGTPVGPAFGRECDTYIQGSLSSDGKRAMLQSDMNRFCVFNVSTGAKLAEVATPPGGLPFLSDDGRRVYYGNLAWNTSAAEPRGSLLRRVHVIGASFNISPSRKTAVSFRGGVRMWDIEKLQPLAPTASFDVEDAAFLPSEKELVGISKHDSRMKLLRFSAQDGRLLRSSAEINGISPHRDLNIHAVSADGRLVLFPKIAESGDVSYQVYTTEALSPVATLPRNISSSPSPFLPLKFSPDGRAIVGTDGDAHLAAWEISSRQFIQDPPDAWRALILSGFPCPDGKSVLTKGADDALRIVDLGNSERQTPPFPISMFGGYDLRFAVALSGAFVLTPVAHSICLWDSKSGQPAISSITSDYDPVAGAISPDEKSIVSYEYRMKDSDWILSRHSIERCLFSPADCEILATFLSGRKIDGSGGIISESQTDFEVARATLLRLKHDMPRQFDVSAIDQAPEVLPTYRNVLNARVAAAKTEDDKKNLAREWAWTGGQELHRGTYKEVALLEEKSLTLDDSSLAARDHLAHVYVCLGRFSEALAIYQKYWGQTFQTPQPWGEEGIVGGDLSDLATLWPDGNEDPSFRRIVRLARASSSPQDSISRAESQPATGQ